MTQTEMNFVFKSLAEKELDFKKEVIKKSLPAIARTTKDPYYRKASISLTSWYHQKKSLTKKQFEFAYNICTTHFINSELSISDGGKPFGHAF